MMNPVEIADAVTNLFSDQFDPECFPFAFLEAFGNMATTVAKLKSGASNASDIPGGVLQRNHIHLATCSEGDVSRTLAALKASPATLSGRNKVKFVLATDGATVEAEDLTSGETRACAYADFPEHFGFFLPLAGISTVKQIRESSFDIRATGRLNKLYLELRKENPDWDTPERRHDMNHFMARLIFCFFAEDTDIFIGGGLFTDTIAQMSARDSSNTHEVIETIFRAMNTRMADRPGVRLPLWADAFPFVNGGLFSGSTEAPRFNKSARAYLLHIGALDWRQINPDIFGSMIQAVAEDEERGALGMHYTSVPNILKVLNPLFLDDLREKLTEAGDNARKLLNLRNRMARIRVFDPACGSGNFLVIAYKHMREIEAEINKRRGEPDRRSDIPLTNFRGIELRDFPAEIARLALIIAEYQCDVLYRGPKMALADFLPLNSQNWITCGNALRLDWSSICPPEGTGVKHRADDLFGTPLEQAQIDFENAGGETYICGNPPYKGSRKQEATEKDDLQHVFSGFTNNWKNVDYVGAWLMKAAIYNDINYAPFSFVATNSICQGQQVPIIWHLILQRGFRIRFAHTSFKWSNLAANKAGVTVVVTGVDRDPRGRRWIFNQDIRREVPNINPYLTHHDICVVPAVKKPFFLQTKMEYGVYYSRSAGLMLDQDEKDDLVRAGLHPKFTRRFLGSTEYINGKERYCLWINDDELAEVCQFKAVRERLESVRRDRIETRDAAVNKLAARPYQFRERKGDETSKIFVPIVSAENREYFPAGLAGKSTVPTNKAFYIPDGPLWLLSIITSKMHLSWIDTICGRLRTDYSYSNTLGWNTFPVPKLTEQDKADLTRSAEDILLAREHYFPATIADMYDPDRMDTEFPLVREAHERNDETLERIYIGRRFRSDTERLEKLFDMYVKMTAAAPAPGRVKKSKAETKSKKVDCS